MVYGLKDLRQIKEAQQVRKVWLVGLLPALVQAF
jgi:hypothetical protein